MTTVQDTLTYADGSMANGRLVVTWKPFTVGNVNVAGGELEWEIVEGNVTVSLYSNTTALPVGVYYVAKYELENGPVYVEQWMVPNLPTVTIGQVRVNFPPTPSVMISPLQLSPIGSQPGMFLMWNGSHWVPGYPTLVNFTPNTIGLSLNSLGSDVSVAGSPAYLGQSLTLSVPDAGPAARGVVTTGVQTINGLKTFLNTVTISTSIQFTRVARNPTSYGELLANGTGGLDTELAFGGNIVAARVAGSDRTYMQADRFVGGSYDMSTVGAIPTVAMPGSLASPTRAMASILFPVASGIDWSGIGTGVNGTIWLRTGTTTSAGFLYLDTAGNVTCRELRMDPYQHQNAATGEAARTDATMVMYSITGQWAGYGVNVTPEIWFRLGPDNAGVYYYFGQAGARFPSLTVGSLTITGPGGFMVDPTTTKGDLIARGTSAPATRLGVGSDGQVLTADSTLGSGVKWAAVPGGAPDTSVQQVQLALAGVLKSTRHQINFVAGSGVNLNLVDDAANNQGTLTVTAVSTGAPSPSIFSVNGAQIGTQSELNLIASTGVTLAGNNNIGAGRVDITVTGTAAGAVTSVFTRTGAVVALAADYAAFYVSLTGSYPDPLWITSLSWGKLTGVPATFPPAAHTHDASAIVTGVIATARLGTGTASSTTYLRGDSTWQTVATGVPTTRQVIAGVGLSGGGSLAADVTLNAILMGASGASHSIGIVPDPGATAGSTRYLREDASWAVPPGTGSSQTPWLSDINGANFALGSVRAVGIGRAAAASGSYSLAITTASTVEAIQVQNTSSAGAAAITLWNDQSFAFQLGYGGSAASGWPVSAAFLNSASAMIFMTNSGVERMRITAAGNAGIGLTAPTRKLEISAAATTASYTSTTINLQRASGSTSFAGISISGALAVWPCLYSPINTDDWAFGFDNGSGIVEKVRIAASGNVGIGTTGPTSFLSVVGGGSAGANDPTLTFNAANTIQFASGVPGVALAGGVLGSAPNSFWLQGRSSNSSGFSYPLALNPLGATVGIGTSNPTCFLTVVGGGSTGSNDPSLTFSAANTILFASGLPGVALAGGVSAAAPNGFWFQARSSNSSGLSYPLVLNPLGGNVGIGTTNPLNLFQVHCAVDQNIGIRSFSSRASIGTFNDAGSAGVPLGFDASRFDFSGGSVGIGKLPGYALDVAGDCNVTGVYRVNGTPISTSGYSGPTTQSNATASRSFATVYQNTSGKPMFVNVSVTAGNGAGMTCYTDTATSPTTVVAFGQNINTANQNVFCSFVVLANSYYKVTSAGALNAWIEWW